MRRPDWHPFRSLNVHRPELWLLRWERPQQEVIHVVQTSVFATTMTLGRLVTHGQQTTPTSGRHGRRIGISELPAPEGHRPGHAHIQDLRVEEHIIVDWTACGATVDTILCLTSHGSVAWEFGRKELRIVCGINTKK